MKKNAVLQLTLMKINIQFSTLPESQDFSSILSWKTFKNTCGEGENAGHVHFPFQTFFFIILHSR